MASCSDSISYPQNQAKLAKMDPQVLHVELVLLLYYILVHGFFLFIINMKRCILTTNQIAF
jgi:hypothetical protein